MEYVRRCEGVSLKMMNITEREAFMSGKKLIAIISEVSRRQGCWEAFCGTGRGSASAGFG